MSDIRFVSLNGHRVAYREAGDPTGEPLAADPRCGRKFAGVGAVVRASGCQYRVIAPDLLGHGESDKPRADYSLGTFAALLRDFLDALELPAATLVGHSLGGGIALQFVYQHRQYCRRLVLVNSGGLGTDVSMPLRLLSTPGAELLLPVVASRPAVFLGNGVVSLIAARTESSRVRERWRKYSVLADPLGHMRSCGHCALSWTSAGRRMRHRTAASFVGELPTLIVAGAQDRVIPAGHAQAAHAALPGSRLEIIDEAGHHPQLDCPATLAQLIDEFASTTDEPGLAARRGA